MGKTPAGDDIFPSNAGRKFRVRYFKLKFYQEQDITGKLPGIKKSHRGMGS
jgi:hypothetical protein